MFLGWLLAPFLIQLWLIFYVFCIPFSSIYSALICHRFCDGFWYIFWCLFDTFSVRAHNLLNLKKYRFYNDLKWFYHSEKHDFWWCSWFFHYLFWHWFLLSSGIDFSTPLVSNSMFWSDRFWGTIWGTEFWSISIKKNVDDSRRFGSPFSIFVWFVPQVLFLKLPWLTLVPFWIPFDSILIALGTLFDPF